MSHLFTISAYTHNRSGILHRLTAVFTRRKVNIESLCVSETETEGISRFTISVKASEALVKKMVAQIAKIFEVVQVHYYTDSELIFKEIALIKVVANLPAIRLEIENCASKFNASLVVVTKDCVVIEKTGTETEIRSLYLQLEPYGIIEFVRSGRVSLERNRIVPFTFTKRQIVTSGNTYVETSVD